MPLKTSIYLPDDLAEQVRAHGIVISEVTQTALRKAVHAAILRETIMTDIHAVAERLRGTIDKSAIDSRDRGRRDGITWAKEHATAGELVQLANLDDSVLVVSRPHTLVSFISTTSNALHQLVKVDTEDPYWAGFQAGAGDVWDSVEPLLRQPTR
jgi:hypothetical protein